jgi:uncharacterized protein
VGAALARLEQLNKIIQSLKASSSDIGGVVVLSEDGLMIAGSVSEGADEVRISAAAAALLSEGARAGSALGRGTVSELIIKGTNGYAILSYGARNIVLVAYADRGARLGALMLAVQEAVAEMNKVLAP